MFACYLGHEFLHTHESEAFYSLYDRLAAYCETRPQLHWALYGNVNLPVPNSRPRELDGLLIKDHALILLEFKNFAGRLEPDFTDRPWYITPSGGERTEIKGGSHTSLLSQVTDYRYHLKRFMSDLAPSRKWNHIATVIFFHAGTVTYDAADVPAKYRPTFFIADRDTVIRKLAANNSDEITVNDELRDKITAHLEAAPFTPPAAQEPPAVSASAPAEPVPPAKSAPSPAVPESPATSAPSVCPTAPVPTAATSVAPPATRPVVIAPAPSPLPAADAHALRWLLAADCVPYIGPKKIDYFIRQHGTAAVTEAMCLAHDWSLPSGRDHDRPAPRHLTADELRSGAMSADRILTDCRDQGIVLLPCWEPAYPPDARRCPERPYVLYVKGALECLTRPVVGVTGWRDAPPDEISAARDTAAKIGAYIGRRLHAAGLTVGGCLSGDCDGAALNGAVAAGSGRVVAVAAYGLAPLMPDERELAARILERGGILISPYPPGENPAGDWHHVSAEQLLGAVCRCLVVCQASPAATPLPAADVTRRQRRRLAVWCPPPGMHPEYQATRWAACNREWVARRLATQLVSPKDLLTFCNADA